MPLVRVAPGDVLTVNGQGTVAEEGNPDQRWHVSDGPLHMAGPGLYRLDGTVTHTVRSKTVAALESALPRATEIIRSSRIIAAALTGRSRSMALSDKAQHFAERMRQAPKRIEAAFDSLLVEVDDMEKMAVDATTRAAAVVADAKAGVRTVVDIVNQLSNGDPA